MVFFSMARIQVLLLIVILTYCSICSARPYGIYEDYDNWSSESGSDPRQVFYKSITMKDIYLKLDLFSENKIPYVVTCIKKNKKELGGDYILVFSWKQK